ncbi:unnamed protein product [Allacma fusca]|uniref:MIF4G domain-containing protein n=1 Tax=Allacma fusca TaxID=39272 RepID=A0A8J2L149_9HEXA|nr:unnamed protein product [Allacma fusca]
MDSHSNGTNSYNYGGNDNGSPSSLDYGQGQQGNHGGFDPRFYGDVQENEKILEALLPALKTLDINQIPPDVLAHLLKTKRIDQLVASSGRQFGGDGASQGQGSYMSSQGGQSPSSGYGSSGGSRGPNSSGPQSYPNDWQGSNSEQQQGNYGSGSQSRGQPRIDNWNQPVPSQQSAKPRNNYHHSGPNNTSRSADGNSALSPLAREFVPRVPQYQQQQQPQGRRSQRGYDQDPSHWEYDAQNMRGPKEDDLYLNQFDHPSDFDADADCVLGTVTDTINQLAMNPADFQRCCLKTTQVLKTYLNDPDTLGVVVTLIFEQSVSNPNFCYSGARLCQAFNKNEIAVAVDNTRVTFKNLLIERCQEEFTSCLESMDKDPEMENRAPGVIMFLAELYLNFVLEISGKSTKNMMFGLAAVELMTALVTSKPTNFNKVKAIFRTLKLIGWELDHDGRKEITKEMEKLIKELSYLLVSPELDQQCKSLLETLFDLRKKDWNKSGSSGSGSPSSSPGATGNASPQYPSVSQGAESQYYELPDTVDEEDYSLCIDDEPEEVRRAYEEFLKMTSGKK